LDEILQLTSVSCAAIIALPIWHTNTNKSLLSEGRGLEGRSKVAISIIGSIVLGAFLGQFCRVFVLFPIMAVVLASELGNACYFGLGFGRSLCEFALISTSLQIGFFAIPAFYTVLKLPRRVRLQRRQPRSESGAIAAPWRH
jgi:hypothetical protein